MPLAALLQLLPVGLDLIARGTALVNEINQAGNKPGGPTDEDVKRIREKYNISDDQLHELLVGSDNGG